MGKFIDNIKKYAVVIADVVFIISAVANAANSFIRAIDDHYPPKDTKHDDKE